MSDMGRVAFAKALQNQTGALRSKDGFWGDDRLIANDQLWRAGAGPLSGMGNGGFRQGRPFTGPPLNG